MKSSFTSVGQRAANAFSPSDAAIPSAKRPLAGYLAWGWRVVVLLILLGGMAGRPAYALQGNDNCADPSTIIKDGNKYWIFTTGTDIYAMYSYDLVSWQSGPTTVFNGARPAWIAAKVPNFAGEYWAPECVYRNGKYYLYYSCSTFGSNVSAIGLATNVTLDPASPNYQWVDQGEVVSTNASSPNNAIDPALVTDAAGAVWMTFGSFFKGIGLIQIDPATGKRLGTSFTWIAGNVAADGTRGSSGSEASYIVRNGAYYYLFLNKGKCCLGSSSTYYIQVGRSSSVTGPYLDKNGVDMNKNGGTTLIATSGNYVGPGCVGLYIENGVNYLTHHYYDSNQNGRARLCVGNMGWDASAWPFITRDWIASGRYSLTNQNNSQVWDDWGCTGALYEAVAQNTSNGLTCQKWNLTPVGNGEYKIISAQGAGLAAEVVGNSPNNGAKLQLNTYSGAANQRFKIERTNANNFVLSSVNGNRVVEVPACSTTAGTTLALYDYLGNNCQKWQITAAAARTALTTQTTTPSAQFSVYPNPTARGRFVVMLGAELAAGGVTITLSDMQGRAVYERRSAGQATVPVTIEVRAGLYQLRVSAAQGVYTQKIIVE